MAIHQGTIFGALTLLTGSIWARASWGVWWTWSSNQLVLFLVLFLFYCAYFMLRFSLEDGPRRARLLGRVCALRRRSHPREFSGDPAGGRLHPSRRSSRARTADDGSDVRDVRASWAAMTLLAYVLYRVELAGKRLDADLRELREALE